MTLADPKNRAKWATGEPRSQGNAFDVTYTPSAVSRSLQRTEEARARSAKQVRDLQAKGHDLSLVALRSRGAAYHGGAYSKSKPGGK